ncbi:MAG: ATP-dependent Clp protease ATP-binding subunit, partial [Dehalococcoidia bacterium]
TSNLVTEEFQRQSLGFSQETKGEKQRLKGAIDDALKKTFRPEFLNRMDEIVIFESLTEEQIKEIVDLMIKDVQKRLVDRKITVELTEEAKVQLAKEGFDPVFGARPLRRTIQRQVENPLSKRILQGVFKEGDHVQVDAGSDGFTFTTDSLK